jgi:hypothetical protein
VSHASTSTLKVGTFFHGRYRVVRMIKAGGMGAVYEVLDETTNSPRALKVMLPGLIEDAGKRARFALEAKITGNIESEHLVRVFDAGVDEASGEPFLLMDLLRGEELQAIVTKRKVLPPGEALYYLAQLTRVLEKTHAAGIVHRDLKPENLFITRRDDGSPCLKILDFGIAKVVVQHQAQKTRALGTPLYMAPEQIRGESSIGPRADLYSLAHVTYTTLAGEAYWFEDTMAHDSLYPLLMKLLSGAPEAASARALRRTGVRLPPAFDEWFHRATSLDPAARFESATAEVTALAQALGLPSPLGASPAFAGAAGQPMRGPSASGPLSGAALYAAAPQTYPPASSSAAMTPAWSAAPSAQTTGPVWMPAQPAHAAQPPGPMWAPGATPMPQPIAPGQPWMAHAPQSPPAQSAASRWVVPVVIGAVAITAMVVVGVVAKSGSSAAPTAQGTPAPGACGIAAVCEYTSVPDPAHIEPVEILPEMRKLAQRVDSRAALTMILAQGVKDGTVDIASGYGSVSYHFATPEGVLVVVVRKPYTSVWRGAVDEQVLPEPRCSMKAAFKAAAAAGAPTSKPVVMLYRVSDSNSPVWSMTAENRQFLVDATTCAMKK